MAERINIAKLKEEVLAEAMVKRFPFNGEQMTIEDVISNLPLPADEHNGRYPAQRDKECEQLLQGFMDFINDFIIANTASRQFDSAELMQDAKSDLLNILQWNSKHMAQVRNEIFEENWPSNFETEPKYINALKHMQQDVGNIAEMLDNIIKAKVVELSGNVAIR